MTYHGRGSTRKIKGRQRLRVEQLEADLTLAEMANAGLKLKCNFLIDILRQVGARLAEANQIVRGN